MGKPALGRGLGNLLGDTQIADKPEPVGATPDPAVAEVSPGLGNLLKAGRNGGGEKEGATAAAELPSSTTAAGQEYRPKSVYRPEAPGPKAAVGEGAGGPRPEMPEEAPVQAPRWVLLAADVLLIALAMLLVFKSPAPLKPWEMTLCLAAVMLGAVLACVAALSPPRR
ncbi:MAG: hypothetical protein N3J91_13940 [Verrucomicrobiae bacterium]|nr:hypothetical protein [Verrucomicrobiae bacterium]